jgi:hypothetical protein
MRLSTKGLVYAALCVALALPGWGQSYQGGLRGSVKDPGGAVVAVAKATITDEATNVARSTLTNDTGEYVFQSVNPATYTITIESPGFKRFERRGIIIATQTFLTLDIKLDVGEVTETINVTEEVPLMETANASTGQVIDAQKLTDLPNLGRNPFMLAKLAPNVVQAGDPRFNRMQDQSGSSAISIAGGPVRGNNYLLDGVPITDSTNRAVIIPTMEAVMEVKIQASTYDAEVGRTGGGMFNTFLKSGSNQVHGSLLGYLREKQFLANNFFNNRNGVARPDQPFRNFGGSLGGPVWIPRLYDGRNKSFWFVSQEAYRQKSGLSREFALPTALERAGDFSRSLDRAGAVQPVFDPLTSQLGANGAVSRQQFPGNIIPASRLNPIGLKLASYYPTAQRAPRFLGDANYLGSDVLVDRADQYTAKFDHELFSWWKANLSYLHYKSREPGGNLFNSVAGNNPSILFRKVDSTQTNHTLTPTPTMVLSIRYGFNRFPNATIFESEGFDVASLGFPTSLVSQLPSRRFPSIGMQTFSSFGSGSGSQSVFHSRNFLTSVAKFMGRHSLKAGFDYRILNIDFLTAAAAGSYSFNDTFTRRDPNRGNDGTGSDLASLLLGIPASGGVTLNTKFYQYVRYYGMYFHDDFRVNSKLTLNLGLRYEYETGLRDRNNALIVGFDPNVASPLGQGVKGGLLYAGLDGNNTECCGPPKNKWAPRLGVAYQWDPKTTIRGGYGLYWAPVSYGGFSSLGYSQTTDYIGSFDGGQTPAGSLSNPFPSGLTQPFGNKLGVGAGIGQAVTFMNPQAGSTSVHQFSFDLQRQMPGGVVMALGYVGSRTHNLILGSGTINLNQLRAEQLGLGSQLLQSVPNPYFGRGGSGVIGSANVQRVQLVRPFPQFSSVSQTFNNQNDAVYDSLVLKAQKRFSAGLSFLASWTWSRNLDASFGAGNYFSGSSASAQDSFNLAAEYGLSLTHTPHAVKGSVSYELPFGKNKPFLNQGALWNHLAGGWQMNAVYLFQTGFPLAVFQNQNFNSIFGNSLMRPNATGTSPVTTGNLTDRLDNYINASAFATAPQFTFGNLARTLNYRGPGTINWDLSLLKTFTFFERLKGQFRAEATNAFNTAQFNGPNTAFGNVNFGRITQQANFPRYVQLGVRVTF